MHALRALLDALFPPSPEAVLVRQATLPELLARASVRSAHEATALLPFRDPLVRALIHEAKFKCNHRAIDLLAGALREHCPSGVTLVPIPLSRERRRERGYNQTSLIARAAGLSTADNLLVRTRNTPPQTSLARRERLENLQGAFTHQSHTLPHDTPLLVLDDVTTTGATLREAVSTLRKGGFREVRSLALAH